MKTFLHVLYTWLAANFIYYFIWLLIDLFVFSNDFNTQFFSADIFIFFSFILLASIPSFLVSLAFVNAIIPSSYSDGAKLFLWYLATVFTVSLNIILPILIFAGSKIYLFSEELILIGLPAIGAVFISISIRYKQFFNLLNNCKQIINQ